jgi:serine protease Do
MQITAFEKQSAKPFVKQNIARCFVLAAALSAVPFVSAQAGAIRDYVGVIHQTYHPDVVNFINKVKDRAQKRGYADAVKAYDNYLKGGFGTGFVYTAPDGANYILTNNHVISQADTLSITFERADGTKTTYDRLRIVAADEDIDIAILTFAGGIRPFPRGLALASGVIEDLADVYAAGFPGLGSEASWRITPGKVTNAAVRLPADPDKNTPEVSLGPYIEHSAPLDFGNSGGPLLIQQAGVATGYAVAGINTLSYRSGQNRNFSIPAGRVQDYIKTALAPPDDAALLALLDKRLDSFIKGLDEPRTAYPHIAQYLSNSCVASNAEFAIGEVFDRGPRTVQTDVDKTWSYSPLFSMNIAVAWLIEDSLRGKSTGAIRAAPGSIASNGDGSCTVPLVIGTRTINTVWVNEYGIWKLDKAGDLVTGDKSLLENKEKQRELDAKIRTDYIIAFSVDYAHIFDDRPSVKLAMEIKFEMMLYDFALFFGKEVFGEDKLSAGYLLIGFTFPVKIADKAALMPFAVAGAGLTFRGVLDADSDYVTVGGYEVLKENAYDFYGVKSSKAAEISLCLKAGAKFLFSAVPGLFLEGAYQFDYFLGREKWVKDKDQHRIMAGIGYAF